jgi:hypothetical protein
MKKTIRIQIATSTVWTFIGPRSRMRVWFEHYGAEVDVVDAEEADNLAGVPLSRLPLWLRTQGLHVWEVPGKALHICLGSLQQLIQKTKKEDGREKN